MPDGIEIQENSDIIEVLARGHIRTEDITRCIDKVRQIHATMGRKKILINARQIHSMPDTVSIYNLFSNFPKTFHIALLTEPSQSTYRDFAFAETVGLNRGVTIRLFNARNAALQWLNNLDTS